MVVVVVVMMVASPLHMSPFTNSLASGIPWQITSLTELEIYTHRGQSSFHVG